MPRPTPKLAHAIRKRARSLAQAQNTYKQNLAVVNTFMTGVLSSSLPQLNEHPPDWQTFVTAYETATGDALNWVNHVMARLLNVPGEVRNYDSLVTILLQDALIQTALLERNPKNMAALTALNNDLSGLKDQLGLITTFISGAITQLQNFQDVLPGMATQLQAIATASISAANADKQQIASLNGLNAQIQQLQSDIQSLNRAIIALGIADGVALTLGIVVTISAWPFGALAWIAFGPAVAAAANFIALDAEKIKADQSAIAALENQLTGTMADISTLTLLSNTYAAMASQTVEIQTDLQAVLREWQTLGGDVSQAVSDIQAAIADTGSTNFTIVANDLNEAVTEWTAAYTQAGALTVQLDVNNAQLQLGMSSAQVQQALQQGQTVDIITYYNQVSAAARAKRFSQANLLRAC